MKEGNYKKHVSFYALTSKKIKGKSIAQMNEQLIPNSW